MPHVRTPMIRIKARQTKGLQQRFKPQKDLVFPTPKNIGQNGTRVVIDGMPQPAWVAFVADKRPHLIDFRFAGLLNVHDHLVPGSACAAAPCSLTQAALLSS